MRLVAPTAFKGTRSPLEAARRMAHPGDRLLPLSDGGDGFLECLHHAKGGVWLSFPAPDAHLRIREVPALRLPDGTLALECARVVGLAGILDDGPLDPFRATSRGFGELLASCQDAPRLWIGLGGSATLDGGRDWPDLRLPPTTVFCDVRTDLADAARLFGLQKGARPEDLPRLAEALLSQGLPRGPGTGAAGGLGARLLSLGGTLVEGAEAILDALDFEGAARGCEAVLTGEGRLDASTLEGKLPAAVARRARRLGLPVLGRFGGRGPGWEAAAALFDGVAFET